MWSPDINTSQSFDKDSEQSEFNKANMNLNVLTVSEYPKPLFCM